MTPAALLEVAAVASVAALGVFAFMLFTRVLPLERRIARQKRGRKESWEFVEALNDDVRPPFTRDAILGRFDDALRSMQRRFQGSRLALVERDPDGSWRVERVAGDGKALPQGPCADPRLDAVWRDGVPRTLAAGGERGAFSAAFETAPWTAFCYLPWPESPGERPRILVAGLPAGVDAEEAWPFFKALGSHFTNLFRVARELELHEKEQEHLRSEVGETLRRLDEVHHQLVDSAREKKAIVDVASKINAEGGEMGAGLESVAAIIAKAVRADIAAFLLVDEEQEELATQPGAFGIRHGEEGHYRVSLKDRDASSVRVFLTGRPLLSGDAQNDPLVVAKYAEAWEAESLIVVPLSVEKRTIGVLRVGARRPGAFSDADLRLVRMLAEESAVLVESILIYKKLALTARELSRVGRLKDEFVSTVSHEIKTPLTAIHGFISVLQSEDAGPINEQQRHFLSIAEGAVRRLHDIINDLLDISKIESEIDLEFAACDVRDLLAPHVQRWRDEGGQKGIRLDVDLPAGLPPVRADAKWIRSVFTNLVGNAFKFTSGSGAVAVRAEGRGDVVLFCVEDNGIGIRADDMARIFDKFYRARATADDVPGTGLGLSICRKIVERHNGNIWVESKPGRGTKFSFVLPVSRERGERPTAGGVSAAAP